MAPPTNVALRPKLVQISAGVVWLGSPEESGRDQDERYHQVKLSRGFLLAESEVTQGQYQAVMGQNPAYFKGSPDLPVEQVSWFDAIDYCNQLSIKEGLAPCYQRGWHDTSEVAAGPDLSGLPPADRG